MNYNYFYIYLQNLKMGANDASGEGLQYATKNRHQNKFPRKLWRINTGFFAQKRLKAVGVISLSSTPFVGYSNLKVHHNNVYL